MATPNNLVYERPEGFTDTPTHYCPGCTHGVAHRLVAEVLEEMRLIDKTIGVAPVGCAVFAYNYFDTDFVEAPHGRAPAMATGIKRVLPDRIVFTYQGDGDLASIGMGEIVHAAARGENLTVIFINNANFGMTGGQMAPTTLPGMKTTSSPNGRDVETQGYPIRLAITRPRRALRKSRSENSDIRYLESGRSGDSGYRILKKAKRQMQKEIIIAGFG